MRHFPFLSSMSFFGRRLATLPLPFHLLLAATIGFLAHDFILPARQPAAMTQCTPLPSLPAADSGGSRLPYADTAAIMATQREDDAIVHARGNAVLPPPSPVAGDALAVQVPSPPCPLPDSIAPSASDASSSRLHRYPRHVPQLQLSNVDEYLRRHEDKGREPVRICLLTSAIAGPTPHGGVGTAFHSLARHLAEARTAGGDVRFAVTVLYAAHPWYGEGTAAHWVEFFGRRRIRFVPLLAAGEEYYGPKLLVRAYRAFQFLKQHDGDFDVVTYADHLGNGYFTAMAKRQGLAFQDTFLMVQCHSTLRWADTLNSRPPRDHNTLAYYHMEQKSVEWADARVSPSRDYLGWYDSDEARFDLSNGPNFVLPNLLYPLPPELEAKPAQRYTHFVFFSRLEVRKGLLVFLDALDRLAQDEVKETNGAASDGAEALRISFVGPDVDVGGEKASVLIRRRLATSLPTSAVRLEVGLTTKRALAYIREADGVAVLPTLGDNSPYVVLEIVAAGLPLITTTAGGGVELLHLTPKTKPFVVPPANAVALAEAMRLAMDSGISTFSAASPFATAVTTYLELLQAFRAAIHPQRRPAAAGAARTGRLSPKPSGAALAGAAAGVSGDAFSPRILVGITSHNRPDVLLRAVNSLLGQTYPRAQLGIVVEDDASDHPDMATTLTRIERQLSKAGLATGEVHRSLTHNFVSQTRNTILQMALDQGFEWACFMVRVE